MISPISSFFKMRLIIAVVLVFFGFFFIGMLHRAFADCLSTCSYWQSIWSWDDIEQSYYPDAQSAFDACYSSHGSSCDCDNASQVPYNYRCRVTGFYYVACQDCDDSEPDGSCDNACDCEETSSSDVCLSDSNVDYTGTTQEVCSYTCKCPDYTGEENYDFETCSVDENPDSCDGVSPSPVESCYSESNINWTDQATCQFTCKCPDYTGQENYDFETCTDPCVDVSNPPPGVCLSQDNITWTDEATCQFTCKCPSYAGEEGYDFGICSIPEDNPCGAASRCDGIENVEWVDETTCEYNCVSCDQYADNCEARCAERGGSAVVCIEDESGHAVSFSCECDNTQTCFDNPGKDTCARDCGANNYYYDCTQTLGQDPIITCECKTEPVTEPLEKPEPEPPKDPDRPKTCFELESNCHVPLCTFWCISGSDGYSTAYNCDCSNNPDPDPSDPRDPDNPADTPPSDDPSDPGDGNGWLSSIKSNTDTLVGQGRESNGWLEGIKKNTDDSLDLDKDRNDELKKINESLKNIAKNQYASSTGSGTSDGSDDGSDDGTVSGTIGTSVDGGYDIDGTGYGESPTDADLPTGEDLDTSFGTFTPSETPSYIDAAESALQSLRPVLASTVCAFDLVFKYESGLVDIDYSQTFDLCQYEAIFNMIGNVLIALASFFNLYKLAFG